MTALAELLSRRIRTEGPISVADYMQAATAHYYQSRDPFGAQGDFVTAPEVSQMFGELIGLWCVDTWRAMGAPTRLILAELGPGRGTLMRDALRAARLAPDFLKAAELHLVETSRVMRERQAEALADHHPFWHGRVDDLPEGPMLLVANEFFDALPVRQFVLTDKGWKERRIALHGNEFGFVADSPVFDMPWPPSALGAIREISPDALAYAAWIGRRVVQQGGAALVIDYGPMHSGDGDTLQALRGHRRADVLRDPGDSDLTAHVDFAALGQAASGAGAGVHGPVEQGLFLRALGIDRRAARLMEASPAQAAAVAAGLRRLTDPDAMGSLFKAMAIADPVLPSLAGFG